MYNVQVFNKKIIWGILAGALAYATYNTRVAYLYSVIFFVGIYIVFECKRKWTSCLVVIGIIVGAMIVAYPQMVINSQYIGKWSPAVNTEQLYGENYDLESVQLYWGLCTPRYETYDGDLDLYEENGVPFRDPVGQEIIRREGIDGKITPKDLLRLALKYPGDIIGIYVRHFANIMVPLWNENCITDLYTDKFAGAIVSIGIWLLVAVNAIRRAENKSASKDTYLNWIITAILVVPSILQTLGGVEIRFFYICYILAYYNVCCGVNYKELWEDLKGKRIIVIVTCIIVAVLWVTILGDTLTRNPHTIMLIGDYYTG